MSNGEIAAAPSLRKMATDLGIDLAKVRGSGRSGRIVSGRRARLRPASAQGIPATESGNGSTARGQSAGGKN